MRALAATDVLELWESGAHRHGLDRSALLGSWAAPDLPGDVVADLPLGTLTATLLRLRQASFGARMHAHLDCGHCGERLELVLNASELLQPAAERPREIEVGGMRVRTPCLHDLAAVADEPDNDRAARQLLARCVVHGPPDVLALGDDQLREVEDALEALDPNADLALEVHCAVCGLCTTAQLDVGALLWDEIEAHARTVLADVHVLACAYGWDEEDILALTATRRAAYLAMVTG